MRILLFCLSLLISVNAFAANYEIDTRGGHAAINFKFKHIGFSWLTGTFRTFSGHFVFDETDLSATSISVDIDPASLDSNHAERDKHIRSSDFLDVTKYPDASFVSTMVVPGVNGAAKVHGNLTLHGQTKPIVIDAKLVGRGDDPWGGYRAGFEGTTTLTTTDFGFKLPPSNTVEMSLYIEGVRQ